MKFRRIIFWLHLIAGIFTGVLVAIMSFTGIAIAFEEEILQWVDRDLIGHESDVSEVLELESLIQTAKEAHPELAIDLIQIPSDPHANYQAFVRWEGPLYINPHTGETFETKSHTAHEILHTLEALHRWLAFSGDWLQGGRVVMGTANIIFVFLCVSGLYLWFPRKWNWRQIKPRLLWKRRLKGKARDYRWHNVIGFWSLPVLVLLAVTAIAISFRWGHDLVFQLYGETPPEARNFGMMAVEPASFPAPDTSADRLPLEAYVNTLADAYPNWEALGIHLPSEEALESRDVSLKTFVIFPDSMPSRAYMPVELDPFTGNILQATHFNDRSAGLRARIWVRFLHTGEAFGLISKVIASIACFGALLLVYTGFSLSWRRFFKN
ncbi:PepSY-associated TM helix domain-containing protein [Coraliomargarita sp. SDUM461003]|uniref:PepSY-associated TM helix domain-containing protein n=1 Tax=Thalassobacterium maritimum TaxID=3041265 RepID=A0ABU1ASQ4_9BACT|nr:PepSY-associated TM helix domain-containing protein [Coraliomargarita sp. SDUM461003]MDQ8207193.1 PepSY-associated TM helix domain-containing protein [Coraliomargarita sp. SDUM461003]